MGIPVIIRREGSIGHISLNRPRALHSLNQEMCEAISDALLKWRDDDRLAVVIIDHADETRGFCAGGDVISARQSVLEEAGAAGKAFFQAEYRLNHLLYTFPKTVIAFMDGVTMGGGVGISLPADIRVATQNTLFAMPEGGIGLFPDVGAGWYLSRLDGQIGKFLTLTGARLDGAECLWAKLATHYCDPEDLAEAKEMIAKEPAAADEILRDLSCPAPAARLAGNKENIDRLFAGDTLEEIIATLSADDSKWAGKELKAVTAKCPTSAKVALRLLANCADDFAAQMEIEYRLAARMIMRHDFADGVRAVLIDKNNAPRWKPAKAEDVDDALLDALFAPLPENEQWQPLA